jgi:hypothetical protein
MLKRHVRMGLTCALVLSLAAIAGAQQVPQPVLRMGNAIELADDVWVNFIGTGDLRYQFTHNTDFESDIEDRTPTRDNTATVAHGGTGDVWWLEARLGADMQYKKHLKFRILMENQMVWDGNRIDNGFSLGGTNTNFPDGRNVDCNSGFGTGCLQRNTFNLERLWIDYTLPNTPLRFRVGADLWYTDPAGVIGDDDPRAAVFATFGNLELSAAIVKQTTSLRAGLTNDNNDMYYNFGIKYDMKPWRFALDTTYFRFRFNQAQDVDTVLIRPSAVGNMGIISVLVQPMFIFGTVDTPDPAQPDYDVKAYGFIGKVEANLGRIRPFVAVVYGSGDGDPQDTDLGAFSPLPQNEITLTAATPYFNVFTSSSSWGARDLFPPATVNLGSGFEFLHSVGNPWSDRVGHTLSPGINTTYSNPGVLQIAPGAKIALLKGHSLDVYYIYRRVMETEPIEQELLNREGVAVSVDETMTHELVAAYSWKPSPWFDLRLTGMAVIPGEGAKDIASAQVCDNATGRRCKGEDVALLGEVRVRARF